MSLRTEDHRGRLPFSTCASKNTYDLSTRLITAEVDLQHLAVEDISTVPLYAFYIASRYSEPSLTELQSTIYKSTVIVGGFRTSVSEVSVSTSRKKRK